MIGIFKKVIRITEKTAVFNYTKNYFLILSTISVGPIDNIKVKLHYQACILNFKLISAYVYNLSKY